MSPPLLHRLRSETRDAHGALEDALALLEHPLRRERFVRALQGFLAFHRQWEPRITALIGSPELLAPRGRIALIEQDLQALGAGGHCEADAPVDLTFLQSRSAAWGSLYVMEGSTLGGQVISKRLRGAAWAPAAGLAYFNPYGRRTAQMWAGFRSALEAAATSLDADSVCEGAQATFHTLQMRWTSPMEAAA